MLFPYLRWRDTEEWNTETNMRPVIRCLLCWKRDMLLSFRKVLMDVQQSTQQSDIHMVLDSTSTEKRAVFLFELLFDDQIEGGERSLSRLLPRKSHLVFS